MKRSGMRDDALPRGEIASPLRPRSRIPLRFMAGYGQC
jgi:hypothetical protein